MRHFNNDQMKRARKTDLYEFLLKYHADSFKREGVSIHPKDNLSLSIKRGYSGYLDFATGEKGNSVDFLVKYMNYELDAAVFALCGELGPVPSEKTESPNEKNPLPVFPEQTEGSFKNLYAYLINRGISTETIKMLIEEKLIYQDTHNNIVFVNKKRNWGERRGTNTYADARCIHRAECQNFSEGDHGWCKCMDKCDSYKKDPYRGMIANSKKDGFWWFHQGRGKADIVYICESSIDAISLYELHRLKKIDENAVYVSIGGAAKQHAIDRIKKSCRVIIAVDNDLAGSQCRLNNAELESIIPIQKDWNDDLMIEIERHKKQADEMKKAILPDGSIDPYGAEHAVWVHEMVKLYVMK